MIKNVSQIYAKLKTLALIEFTANVNHTYCTFTEYRYTRIRFTRNINWQNPSDFTSLDAYMKQLVMITVVIEKRKINIIRHVTFRMIWFNVKNTCYNLLFYTRSKMFNCITYIINYTSQI